MKTIKALNEDESQLTRIVIRNDNDIKCQKFNLYNTFNGLQKEKLIEYPITEKEVEEILKDKHNIVEDNFPIFK